MDEITKDERFKHIAKDARFKIMPKNERKFKVDKRFKPMFSDKKFKLKYSVDKRGRPINSTTNDNLKKFYQLSSEEESSEDEKDEQKTDENKIESKSKQKDTKEDENLEKKGEESEDEDEEDEDEKESGSEAESKSESESESESDSSEEDDDDDESVDSAVQEDLPWNEFDKDTKRDEAIYPRLAICNMDWDRIKAIDLFVLLNSFKPVNGVIKSVKIYLSEYGKQRLEYERLHGPEELTTASDSQKRDYKENDDDSSTDNDEQEEGGNFDRRKLREYQFNRLRYYYAIVDCDSSDTANKIYTECDGMEYESSCTRLDLRFVPDDVSFENDEVREACLEAPDPVSYKPNLFITTALNQTKVECTWDETPRDRLAITMKKYTLEDLKNSDFKNVLATSSEEEDNQDEKEEKNTKANGKSVNDKAVDEGPKEEKNDEESRIQKYRELLLGSGSKSTKKRDMDLEFNWEGGMEEPGFNELLFNKKKNNNKHSSNAKNKNKELTEEEKKEQAQLDLLTMDDYDTKSHFNLDDLLTDKKKSKNKKFKSDDSKKQEDTFQLNVTDPRFEAIFNDHRFNIDPSDQLFKKTKQMENLLNEKVKRKNSKPQ